MQEIYRALMKFVQIEHFSWLYKEGTSMNEYDRDLSKMPDFKSIASWGYAESRETIWCRLQVMMALHQRRLEEKAPLKGYTYLLPAMVSRWNIEKGGVDDMSQVLSHVLNWCGPVNPMQVLWMRVTFVCLYNDWRLH